MVSVCSTCAVLPIGSCAWTLDPWLVWEGSGTSLQEVGHRWGAAGFSSWGSLPVLFSGGDKM